MLVHPLFQGEGPIPLYGVYPAPQWAPLALGMMIAYAQQELDPARFDLNPYWAENEAQLATLIAQHGPGICLFSSYMWTSEHNHAISAWVRTHAPDSLLIHGGPDVPAYPEAATAYLQQHPSIDFGVYGEGEQTLVALLNTLAAGGDPATVPGLLFLRDGHLCKTAPRERLRDLGQLPSPYLTGVFSPTQVAHWGAATIETNRGCPYGCTYCDWGSATLQKIRSFDLERCKAEITWLAQKQVAELWLADANFGIFPRDVEITRHICEVKQQYGYPQRIILNYAKNTKDSLLEIVELLIGAQLMSTGIISMQTRDEATLKAVRRNNIKLSEYDRLRRVFEARQLPLSTQIMIGLPEATEASFREDLRYFFPQAIDVQIFRTMVLPNSPMADPAYKQKHGITHADNGLILSTASASATALNRMEHLARLYRCSNTYGMFHLLLSYLEWEHGVDPISALEALRDEAQKSTGKWLPTLYDRHSPSHDMMNTHMVMREHLRAAGAWDAFYQEIGHFLVQHFALPTEPTGLATILQAQAWLMPAAGRSFPATQSLAHDVVRYYWDHKEAREAPRPLESYRPGALTVHDPFGLSSLELIWANRPRAKGRPWFAWELLSPLASPTREDIKCALGWQSKAA